MLLQSKASSNLTKPKAKKASASQDSSNPPADQSLSKKGFLRDRIAKWNEVEDIELGVEEQENSEQQPDELAVLTSEDTSGKVFTHLA